MWLRPCLISWQVEQLKALNSDLESQTAQLGKSNEQLADDEGRWYSLARELENQMEIIKKASPLSLQAMSRNVPNRTTHRDVRQHWCCFVVPQMQYEDRFRLKHISYNLVRCCIMSMPVSAVRESNWDTVPLMRLPETGRGVHTVSRQG